MFPLGPMADWQEGAQAVVVRETGFASNRRAGDAATASALLRVSAEGSRDCYPFPSDWPGPQKAGPFFAGSGKRCFADVWPARGIRFAMAGNPLKSTSIITNNRGGPICVKPSLSFPLLPCRWLAACKTPHRAGFWARQLAQAWPMPPVATRLQARLLAALAALRLAASMWGCRPAIDLTPAPFGRGLSFMTASRV